MTLQELSHHVELQKRLAAAMGLLESLEAHAGKGVERQ